jgi:hypothetical protein
MTTTGSWMGISPPKCRINSETPHLRGEETGALVNAAIAALTRPHHANKPPVPLVWPPPDRPRPTPGGPDRHAAVVNLPARPHPGRDAQAGVGRVDYGPPA